MKYLFFDSETNGLPHNYKAQASDVNNWPRVIEFSFQVWDDVLNELTRSEKHLIKPDGWTIPNEKFWIDNGFSTEKNAAEGKPISEVLDIFVESLSDVQLMVAHNIDFDYPIVAAEMIRANKKSANKPAKFCTMKTTTSIVKAPHARGGNGYKWPTLNELHTFLFKVGFEGAHDSGNDVTACRLCFFELFNQGHLTELPQNL